jgi:glycerophosphoryl diester phosphodiesterase
MIEFDVQRCGSGELVVFHDDTLDRLTSASGRVSATDWERLRELTILDSTETIPRFDDFLKAVPADTAVNIELKHAGMAEEIVSAAEDSDNEVLVSSFWPDAIQEIRDRNETIDLAFLINQNPEGGRSFADDVGCVAVNPSVEMALESDFVERAHGDGFEVNVWAVNDSETAGRLVDVGADGLFVDRWDLLDG